MSSGIRRAPRRERYTVVSNSVIEDPRLSWKATMLLVYLLSKPDNWRTNREHLAKVKQDGITAVRAGLKELEDVGYLVRQPLRDPQTGRMLGTETVVYEVPPADEKEAPAESSEPAPAAGEGQESHQPNGGDSPKKPQVAPTGGFSDARSTRASDPPTLGERAALVSTETKSPLKKASTESRTPSSTGVDAQLRLVGEVGPPDPLLGFDKMWEGWPRRNGKKLHKRKAQDVWRTMTLDQRRAAWRGARNYALGCLQGSQGAMDLFRWLRQWLSDEEYRREWETPPVAAVRSNGRLSPQQQRRAATAAALAPYIDPGDSS